MIPRYHKNSINEPIRVWGITFYELAMISAVCFIMFIVLVVMSAAIGLPLWLILFPPTIWLGTWRLLKYVNKQNHPDFLKSYLSFKIEQPKRIVIKDPNFYGIRRS